MCISVVTQFILYVKRSRKLSYFRRRRRLGCESNPGLFGKNRMLYSIQRQRLYCFCHRGCGDRRPFGPYFRSLLPILQCSKRHGPCLIQVSNTHSSYSSEFSGGVLHEELPVTHRIPYHRTSHTYPKPRNTPNPN